jgi:heme A synthase
MYPIKLSRCGAVVFYAGCAVMVFAGVANLIPAINGSVVSVTHSIGMILVFGTLFANASIGKINDAQLMIDDLNATMEKHRPTQRELDAPRLREVADVSPH